MPDHNVGRIRLAATPTWLSAEDGKEVCHSGQEAESA
jgi:hypothetical protein